MKLAPSLAAETLRGPGLFEAAFLTEASITPTREVHS